MLFFYYLGSAIGFNLVFIIFCVAAILFKKFKSDLPLGWIFFIIGAVIQTISIIGSLRSLSLFGGLTLYSGSQYILSAIIAAVTIILLIRIGRSSEKKENKQSRKRSGSSKKVCPACGAKMSEKVAVCPQCGMLVRQKRR